MGSLFRVKDFWQTRCGADEEFDGNAIAVGNVDNAKEGGEKIVLGSINGEEGKEEEECSDGG